MNYYNEFDPKAAAWLRELIRQGHLPAGDVDERSITDVKPNDLRPYTQCHFFAGIAGWPLALKLAGWPADRPVWTGSCPCQPFSSAGKRGGFHDERHLWPVWYSLIRECRPVAVFGEQVANKDALPWLDLVQANLENEDYAFGAADLCAAGIGAPHIRQRLYWGAYDLRSAASGMGNAHREHKRSTGDTVGAISTARASVAERVADSTGNRCQRQRQGGEAEKGRQSQSLAHGVLPDGSERCGSAGRMVDANSERRCVREPRSQDADDATCPVKASNPAPVNGQWRDADWLLCRDGKWRPVEPSTFPLAHGIPARVVRLRGYGNAIVPALAAEFVQAFEEARSEGRLA